MYKYVLCSSVRRPAVFPNENGVQFAEQSSTLVHCILKRPVNRSVLQVCNIRPSISQLIVNIYLPTHDLRTNANQERPEFCNKKSSRANSAITQSLSSLPRLRHRSSQRAHTGIRMDELPWLHVK